MKDNFTIGEIIVDKDDGSLCEVKSIYFHASMNMLVLEVIYFEGILAGLNVVDCEPGDYRKMTKLDKFLK